MTIDADHHALLIYLDGAVVGENDDFSRTPSDLGNTTQNWLGRSQWPADAYFKGSLDDFRIYNRVLSPAEIDQLVTAAGGAATSRTLPGGR